MVDTIHLPEDRQSLECVIETLIAHLDALDGDCDLEPTIGARECAIVNGSYWPPAWSKECNAASDECEDDELEDVCEDEGAQCDDEGAIETDMGASEDDGTSQELALRAIRFQMNGSAAARAAERAQAETSKACLAAINALQTVQRRKGVPVVPRLRVLGGAIHRLAVRA